MYIQWRSQDFSEGGGHSDDTIVGGSGSMPPPRKCFGIFSLKRHFLHFEGTFEQNI